MHLLLALGLFIAWLNNESFAAGRYVVFSGEKEPYIATVAAHLPENQVIDAAVPNREQRLIVRRIIAEYLCKNRDFWPLIEKEHYYTGGWGGQIKERTDLSNVSEIKIDHLPTNVLLGLSYTPDEALRKARANGNDIGAQIALARGAKEPAAIAPARSAPASPTRRAKPRSACPCGDSCSVQ